MDKYARSLAGQGQKISPEDSDYKEKLIHVVQSFRTFDVALDDFILHHGYTGELSDIDGKIRFIKGKFNEAGIQLDSRGPKSWYRSHTQADKREIAFQFCFAFHLTFNETEDFFRRVYLQRGIDCHSIPEAVYYYCIRHGLGYGDAQELIRKAKPDSGKNSISPDEEILYTASIIHELNRFQTQEELLAYLRSNKEQFGYNNASARDYIKEMWEKITGEKGMAYREACRRYPEKYKVYKQRSVWDIYQQIFGMIDFDWEDDSRLFAMKGDRTFKPILKNNSLIHPIARNAFPDRQGLERIMKGEWQSDEVVRKTIILLAFYTFWTKKFLKCKDFEYRSRETEAGSCVSDINKKLSESRYPALYEGNPYDWIFLFAAQDEYTMAAFRFFMREVYLYKEEAEA